MYKPEQLEGSVWVLGYEDGERHFFVRRLFEHEGSQYAIMFSMFECEVEALEKEEECCDSCECGHDEVLKECEECEIDEEECDERDIAVLKVITGVDGEPDVQDLTEEENAALEARIEELLEEIDSEDEEEEE